MTETYKIADKNIAIHSIYADVHEYCKDYITDETPDFSVQTAQSDITYEREKSAKEDLAEGRAIRDFTDGYLEELAVYRKIAEKMLDYDTFLFHGSVIAVDGQGYLFTAKSGTGKSTHTRLWREYLGSRAVMVNDDKPLLRVSQSGVTVYGTPYNGKHRLGNNISVPLKCICILERAEQNTIKEISKSDAYVLLLQQTYRPSDSIKMAKTLTLADKMAESVRLYRLGCNMNIEAAQVAYHKMKG